MANLTIANLPRLTCTQLSAFLLPPNHNPNPSVAIVDVRDSDYIGGHIRHNLHVPSSQLDYRAAELARSLQYKDVVVFHCMLSQQRGPSAALRYARERERLLGPEAGKVRTEADGVGQRVCVLTGGFEKWQEEFGEDEQLTEGFVKDLWRDSD